MTTRSKESEIINGSPSGRTSSADSLKEKREEVRNSSKEGRSVQFAENRARSCEADNPDEPRRSRRGLNLQPEFPLVENFSKDDRKHKKQQLETALQSEDHRPKSLSRATQSESDLRSKSYIIVPSEKEEAEDNQSDQSGDFEEVESARIEEEPANQVGGQQSQTRSSLPDLSIQGAVALKGVVTSVSTSQGATTNVKPADAIGVVIQPTSVSANLRTPSQLTSQVKTTSGIETTAATTGVTRAVTVVTTVTATATASGTAVHQKLPSQVANLSTTTAAQRPGCAASTPTSTATTATTSAALPTQPTPGGTGSLGGVHSPIKTVATTNTATTTSVARTVQAGLVIQSTKSIPITGTVKETSTTSAKVTPNQTQVKTAGAGSQGRSEIITDRSSQTTVTDSIKTQVTSREQTQREHINQEFWSNDIVQNVRKGLQDIFNVAQDAVIDSRSLVHETQKAIEEIHTSEKDSQGVYIIQNRSDKDQQLLNALKAVFNQREARLASALDWLKIVREVVVLPDKLATALTDHEFALRLTQNSSSQELISQEFKARFVVLRIQKELEEGHEVAKDAQVAYLNSRQIEKEINDHLQKVCRDRSSPHNQDCLNDYDCSGHSGANNYPGLEQLKAVRLDTPGTGLQRIVIGFNQPIFPDDDDLDCEQSEMANARTPPVFKGVMADNAKNWIMHAELWFSTQRQTSERNKISAIALFFEDAARNWFQSLTIADPTLRDDGETKSDGASRYASSALGRPDGSGNVAEGMDLVGNARRTAEAVVESYAQFKALFLERFKRNPDSKLQQCQDVLEARQKSGQSTESFANEVRNMGILAGMDDETIVTAVKTGLRQDVKAMVMMQSNVETLDDVIRVGAKAEKYMVQPAGTQELMEMVKKLDEKLTKATVCPIINETNHQAAPQQQYNQGYQQPYVQPWIQNQVQRPYNPEPRFQMGQSFGRGGFQQRGRGLQGRGRGNFMARGRGTYQGAPRGTAGGQQPAAGPAGGSTTQEERGYQGPTQGEVCTNCGFEAHSSDQCPATGAQCFRCGRGGHWGRMCRSTANFTNSNRGSGYGGRF